MNIRLRYLRVISVNLRMKRRRNLGIMGGAQVLRPTEVGGEVRLLGTSLCVCRMIWG